MKKKLALILALVLIAAMLVPSAGAASERYQNYVIIGDSIAAGYGPYNYKYKGFKLIENTYASLVGERVAEKTTQLARNGFRTEEVRAMLEDDYVGDSLLFQVSEPREDFPSLMEWYRKSIQNADLITIELGSNDVLNYAYKSALEVMDNSEAFAALREFADQEYGEDFEEMIGQEVAAWEAVGSASGDALKAINAFVSGLGNGLVAFKENWDIIIEDILALNPDARIIVLGNYNLVKTAKITDINLIPVGRMFDLVNMDMNRYLTTVSKYHERYEYIDITDTATYNLPAITDPNFGTLMVSFMHPTLNGHRDIANKILSVLGFEEVPPLPEKQQPAFLEYQDHTAYVSGYGDGTFRPERKVTRAEVVSILYSLLSDSVQDAASETSFSDVGDHWAREKIQKVSGLGLVSGYPDGTFRPNRTITRGEFCAILSKLYSDDASEGSGNFRDVEGHWASPYVRKAFAHGLISGFPDGSFRPNEPLTRAQIVTIMNQVLLRNPDRLVMTERYGDSNPFHDISEGQWFYYDVMEAAVPHTYAYNKDDEVWKGIK